MAVTEPQVMEQLRTVKDPELHKDLVTLNMVKGVKIDGGRVHVHVELTTPACPLKETIENDVRQAISAIQGVEAVEVDFSAQVQRSPQQQAQQSSPLPKVKHIIAIGAGKGGVGKSTVAVNLAVGLSRAGAKVGVVDGDIYGPSLPTLLGLEPYEPSVTAEKMFVPFNVHGIKAMTIGKIVEPGKPLILRGPMAQGAFKQLSTQTEWGELDYLIIDLPPGTGDVPLTMAQMLPLTGAIIVCTPQKVAQDDARRAVNMFKQLDIEVLGIVENMSYFIGDDGKEYDIFGRGGAERLAQEMGVPVLGSIPINMALRANSDNGDPTANFTGDDKLTHALEAFVRRVAGQISVQAMGGRAQQPTISIS